MISRVTAACVVIAAFLASACGDSGTGPSGNKPVVAAVSPAQGTTFGGTPVTITGTNFVAPVTVSIGNAAATNVTLVNPTTIQAVTAAHAQGAADVSVSGSAGAGELKNGFTYTSPSVDNAAPVITAIRVQGTRSHQPANYANIDESVNVTADVTDAETPVSGLKFEWSASIGSVNGAANAVTYTAWHTAGTVTLHLVVTETYTAPGPSGLPQPHENRVTKDATIQVHDEITEIGGMSKKFLDLFSQSSVAPETVMQDFKPGECYAGIKTAAEELEQVRNNRKNYVIVASSIGTPRVTVAFGTALAPFRFWYPADGWAAVTASWTSRCLVKDDTLGCPSVGYVGPPVAGVDWVSSKYDAPTDRWWLCDSQFQANATTLRVFGPRLRGFYD